MQPGYQWGFAVHVKCSCVFDKRSDIFNIPLLRIERAERRIERTWREMTSIDLQQNFVYIALGGGGEVQELILRALILIHTCADLNCSPIYPEISPYQYKPTRYLFYFIFLIGHIYPVARNSKYSTERLDLYV